MANILCVALREEIGLYFKPIIFCDERETCAGCVTALIILVQNLCGPINWLTELGAVEEHLSVGTCLWNVEMSQTRTFLQVLPC